MTRAPRPRLSVAPFCGYGTPEKVTVLGRVLRPRALALPNERDPRWRNFVNIARRFLSREVRGAPVRARVGEATTNGATDGEGYFELEVAPREPLSGPWGSVAVTSPGAFVEMARVRVVGPEAAYGVVSDLDDTVVVTGVTRVWQMLTTVLFGNALTRLPFPGVGALYRALARGEDGQGHNPVFYVSSSPWNLFDLLWAFLEYRRIPPGPILLRDWGLHTLRAKPGKHKLAAIDKLFRTYPHLPFVLVGDSGEQDPEIYREVVRRFPDRVLAVYIREVTGARRQVDVMRLREELRAARVDLVLARDTLAAAHHAHALGLIPARAVRKVGESVSGQTA